MPIIKRRSIIWMMTATSDFNILPCAACSHNLTKSTLPHGFRYGGSSVYTVTLLGNTCYVTGSKTGEIPRVITRVIFQQDHRVQLFHFLISMFFFLSCVSVYPPFQLRYKSEDQKRPGTESGGGCTLSGNYIIFQDQVVFFFFFETK